MKSRTYVLMALFSMPFLNVHGAERSLKIKNKYLNIPVSHRVDRKRMTVTAKGVDTLSVVVRLADKEPEYWVFKDMSAYKGKTVTLSYEGSEESLQQIYQADTIMGEHQMYRERNRPRYHFTTRRGWVNDPNGLIYHDGEYHLFYQHNPYEREWENMHWGHAVSKDLLHWTELNDALYPDALGTMFSGSAVYDKDNTSGFGSKSNPPMVFAYTCDGHHQTQALAYSLDKGRTLRKYKGNPIIDSFEKWKSRDTRDPRLFWYEPDRQWVMVLNERDGHSIYTSKTMRDWMFQSHVRGFWECPDLFPLPVDGDSSRQMWVMYGASSTYMLGTFDGKTFIPQSGKYRYTAGRIYAAQTVTDAPDGRRIQIGWGRVGHPDMPFNGMMLLPTELTLRTTRDGVRLASKPVAEVKNLLHRQYASSGMLSAREANDALARYAKEDALHISTKLHLSYSTSAGLRLHGQNIIDYDTNGNTLNGYFYSPQDPTALTLDLDVYIDRTSVEVFVEDGLFSYSVERNPDKGVHELLFWGNEITLEDLVVDKIDSVW